MTATVFLDSLIDTVQDLSRDLPSSQRYRRLLEALLTNFPCDAAALLRLDSDQLRPLAIEGLSDDTMGRRFRVAEHPRLSRLLHSREPVRFASDSDLPDPYDGLVKNGDTHLHVHDCMGVSLYIDERPWGVLTLDAMVPGTFDNIDPAQFRAFISLAEATVKAAERMERLAARAEHQHQVVKALTEESRPVEIIGESEPIKRLKDEIAIVAQSPLSVLVLGETGVGKELVARQVHYQSQRAEQPLVYVNCAALPESIAESELFGHVKGGFSGAVADRAGKFEVANGGTLFLDEVGELPLGLQATLLRALQSGEIQRVGTDRHIEVDVRIVAATNRDLQEEVKEGRFRADLYHRLSVYPVHVAPLRERGRDIVLLAGYLLEANQRRLGVQGLSLSKDAERMVLSYQWPGNVRELEHVLSRAALRAISSQGRHQRRVVIRATDLGLESGTEPSATAKTASTESPVSSNLAYRGLSMKEAVDAFQVELIQTVMDSHGGNRAAAARDLGVDRGNLSRMMKRLGMLD